jgi:ribosomal protein L11 methyltransferase
LEWLDQQTDLAGKHFIDYGCGSGILAIAALKLGAASVLGIDNDPQALIASLDNAKNNAVDTALILGMPKDLPIDFIADGMLANILALPLIELAPLFAQHLKAGAPIILSGILQEQTDMVCEAYKPYFTIIEISSRDQWMRIVAQRIAA